MRSSISNIRANKLEQNFHEIRNIANGYYLIPKSILNDYSILADMIEFALHNEPTKDYTNFSL